MRLLTLYEHGWVSGGLCRAAAVRASDDTDNTISPYKERMPSGLNGGGSGFSGFLGDIMGVDVISVGSFDYGQQYNNTQIDSGDELTVGNAVGTGEYEASLLSSSAGGQTIYGTLQLASGIGDILTGATMAVGSDGLLSLVGFGYVLFGINEVVDGADNLDEGAVRMYANHDFDSNRTGTGSAVNNIDDRIARVESA